MKKLIVFTGPESSGKSTWSKWFASEYGYSLILEYAREYLMNKKGKYIEEDLLTIANNQQENIRKALIKSDNVIADTDLLTIKIWAEEKYGKCSDTILDLLNNNLPNYYVLCKPDIPWEDDPLRENPDDRDRLFSIYEKEIISLNVPYIILDGDKKNRQSILTSLMMKIEN